MKTLENRFNGFIEKEAVERLALSRASHRAEGGC